jgi:hypothetical protein
VWRTTGLFESTSVKLQTLAVQTFSGSYTDVSVHIYVWQLSRLERYTKLACEKVHRVVVTSAVSISSTSATPDAP